MQLSIGEFRKDFCTHLDDIAATGEPVHVVNNRRAGSPTEAVVVTPGLWEVLMSQPGLKKRVQEYEAAQRQADQSDELPDVA